MRVSALDPLAAALDRLPRDRAALNDAQLALDLGGTQVRAALVRADDESKGPMSRQLISR